VPNFAQDSNTDTGGQHMVTATAAAQAAATHQKRQVTSSRIFDSYTSREETIELSADEMRMLSALADEIDTCQWFQSVDDLLNHTMRMDD